MKNVEKYPLRFLMFVGKMSKNAKFSETSSEHEKLTQGRAAGGGADIAALEDSPHSGLTTPRAG